MRRITGWALAILLFPMGAYAGMDDYPADLSEWIAEQPPERGDDRWWAANYDAAHEWVVYLRGDRPSARLRAVKREEGSPYPERQESYPPMPFAVPRVRRGRGLLGNGSASRCPTAG
jgi:hypothetical protein